MNTAEQVNRLEEALREIPLLDAHTHLDAAHLSARGLDDILLYHMVISDLYSAGCPEGARLSEMPSSKSPTRDCAGDSLFAQDSEHLLLLERAHHPEGPLRLDGADHR